MTTQPCEKCDCNRRDILCFLMILSAVLIQILMGFVLEELSHKNFHATGYTIVGFIALLVFMITFYYNPKRQNIWNQNTRIIGWSILLFDFVLCILAMVYKSTGDDYDRDNGHIYVAIAFLTSFLAWILLIAGVFAKCNVVNNCFE